MRLPIVDVQDVAEAQLCCGCGACAYADPESVRMVDDLDQGRRPVFVSPEARRRASADAMSVCPGIELSHDESDFAPGILEDMRPGWGPILEVWEGHAADEELRHAASSGGASSALALFGIERAGMHGVLHINARQDVPFLNETILSQRREQILAATGSRYAPASPCDRLDLIESAPAPCVFIGKPCDVAAANKARALRPKLDANLGLTVAIFCAGTPTTRASLRLLEALDVDDLDQLEGLRYRGLGWPGMATARVHQDGEPRVTGQLTYDEAWGDILSKDRQWRCQLCIDHTGEFADIAVGDPWYKPRDPQNPGSSLILIRTERGRRVFEAAVEAGYLSVKRVSPQTLPASQMNLLRTRGGIWGRMLALALARAPRPRYRGLPTWRFWWSAQTWRQRLQSVVGTLRRVGRRGLRRRRPVRPFQPDREQSLATQVEPPPQPPVALRSA